MQVCFTAAGYAILTVDETNQKFTSVKKSYAPIAYGSKTFTPSQLKMSIYAKEFLAIYYAFKEFGHIFGGTPKPVIILTDDKTVTRFFPEPIIQIDASTENSVEEITIFTQKLRRTKQIILEQSKDQTLRQLKAKNQQEEYSEEFLQQDIRYKHYLHNFDRLVQKDEILKRHYYDETGHVNFHQLLLPKHLLKELLQAIHGTAHRHSGISKMLQEIRQKYYYPRIAKHVKKWVEGFEICAKDKNNTITPELPNLPEWDLGPENAMQIDLLPNLTASGGYQTVMTAIDVFSRYLFASTLLIEATATNVAKVIIDIMTKHSYLPTTVITDKGSTFTSTIIAEITKILGITLRCATTEPPQTIGKLERTHASLKTNLKMASGEYRRQWHSTCHELCSTIILHIILVLDASQVKSFMAEFLSTS